jgi:uncharacterized membrane protein
MEQFISDISKTKFPVSERVSGKTIRRSILQCIQQDHPQFTPEQCISLSELNRYRQKHITDILLKEISQMGETEQAVIKSLAAAETITDKVEDREMTAATLGQRVADRVATFGGSWTFIILFGSFLAAWIALNLIFLHNRGFDPFPFILLNLILSCLAAIQAPVIMMSQNRQEEKDRDRAKKDYMINLKSELEIRMLHEKIDHLIINQQQELLEIQKVQIEMMTDILKRVEK